MMKNLKEILKQRIFRTLTLVFIDIVTVFLCFFTSFFLTLRIFFKNNYWGDFSHFLLASLSIVIITMVFLFAFRMYKVVWHYAKPGHYLKLVLALTCSILLFGILDSTWWKLLSKAFADFTQNATPYITTFPVYALFMFLMTFVFVFLRITYQSFATLKYDKTIIERKKGKLRTMIIGAGFTGNHVLDELNIINSQYSPICFLDDNVSLVSGAINNIVVAGKVENIKFYCDKYDIDLIIFAIPSLVGDRRSEILKECSETGRNVKVIPALSEIIEKDSFVQQMRDINVADLLGREQIKFEKQGIKDYIAGKTIMVTGGGGSIGSELCRQISSFNPKRIVIVEVYENCAYAIQQEMKRRDVKFDFEVEILSVTDYDKVEEIFKQYHPEIVFHAAAHKHVPLMETNPEEAVKNNVFGTFNVIKLADKYNVEKFILISTDKAVNPTNVMGATKRCCEMILQTMSKKSKNTKFAAVRFGNVLGSNGSVIPLFKQQIENGGPVTVTHKDIIRYFMTIPEAVSLVLQAGAYAESGETFVLDMGEQVKIVTLAENLIRVMGYKPYEEIDIKFTGLRPGEKLYEELLMGEEGLRKTANDKIFIGKQIDIDSNAFYHALNEMEQVCKTNDKELVVNKLKELVPTFKHDTAQFNKMQEHTKQIMLEFTMKNKAN